MWESIADELESALVFMIGIVENHIKIVQVKRSQRYKRLEIHLLLELGSIGILIFLKEN